AILLYLINNFLLYMDNLAHFIPWFVHYLISISIDIICLEIIRGQRGLYIANRTAYKHGGYLRYQLTYIRYNVRRLHILILLLTVHNIVGYLAFVNKVFSPRKYLGMLSLV